MNIFKNRPLASVCAFFLLTFYTSYYIGSSIKPIICAVGLLLGLLLIIKNRYTAAVLITVSLSLLFGYFYFNVYIASSQKLVGKNIDATYEVVDISYQNDGIVYFDAKDTERFSPTVHLTLKNPNDKIGKGDIISASVLFSDIISKDDFNSERYYRSKGIFVEGVVSDYTVKGHNDHPVKDLISRCRYYCVEQFEEYTNDDASALLSALTLGDKSNIDGSIIRDFSRTGISHMLAISGMHLSVIMGMFMAFTSLFSVDRRISTILIMLICIFFILLSGASLSVLRAGSMFLIMLAGRLFRKMKDSLTSLFFGVSVIVLISPSSVFDAGLILSFTSTLGILIVLPSYLLKVARIENITLPKKLFYGMVTAVLTTLSAMAFSFIPLIYYFDNISLVSVLANLLISPIMSVVLCFTAILLCVSWFDMFAWMIGEMINGYVWIIYKITAVISSVPNASVSLKHPFTVYTYFAVIVGIVILILFRKKNAYLMPYLCWFATFVICLNLYNFSYSDSSDVLFYSESGSDAVLLRNKSGCVYLDLGIGSLAAERRAFNMLKNELYSFELDYWIIADYESVSWRGLSEALNEYYVRNIVIPVPHDGLDKVVADEIKQYAEKENVKIIWFEYGKSFVCNGNIFSLYAPLTFEKSSSVILCADIMCNDEKISYYGKGYFEYALINEGSDYIYIGEYGSKRKQKAAPELICDHAIIGQNNITASSNIKGKTTLLTDDDNFLKFRIG